MIIGIDIDGVLTDIEKWQLDYGSRFYYNNYKKEIVNPKRYETFDIFKSSPKYDDKFWEEHFIDYSINVKARDFSREVIQKLREDGNKIVIITARGNFLSHSRKVLSYEENKKIVKEWLKKIIFYMIILFSLVKIN